jgi:hypothetical protein
MATQLGITTNGSAFRTHLFVPTGHAAVTGHPSRALYTGADEDPFGLTLCSTGESGCRCSRCFLMYKQYSRYHLPQKEAV